MAVNPFDRSPQSSLSEPPDVEDEGPISTGSGGRWLLLLVAVAAVGFAAWKGLGGAGDPWHHTMEAGLAACDATGKPMLVLYTADWCPPCRQMKRDVFSDAGVKALLEAYVLVKIDLTTRGGPNARLAADQGVRGIPTMILYGPRGTEVDRISGGLPKSVFVSWLGG